MSGRQAIALKAASEGVWVVPEHLFEMLDAVGDVVIIVSRDRRIRYCNRAAREFLGRKGPLRIARGRLACATGLAEFDLGRAVDAACSARAAGLAPITFRQAVPFPVLLLIKCLDEQGETILLLAADNHVLGTRVVKPLRNYFGLTRSEALVAGAIAEGKSLAAIAAERSVALATIRTQVKTIAAKLGCTRQSQISAIVRSIPYASLED